MTVLPSWAEAGLKVLNGSDNHRVSAEPITQGYQPLVWDKVQKLVSTYTREEIREQEYSRAGHACDKCPQPLKNHMGYVVDIHGSQIWKEKYTKRCTSCDTKAKRYTRARAKVRRLELVAAITKRRISFVTLTFPNWIGGNPREGIKFMKNLVADFRHDCRTEYKHDIDGYDFYEYTIHEDFRGWSNPWEFNVHSHSLWVMKYWDQDSIEESWGHGIVHLKRLTGKHASRKATNYAIKYGTKATDGHRNSQGFGLCYGRAYAELESQVNAVLELRDAEDVPA